MLSIYKETLLLTFGQEYMYSVGNIPCLFLYIDETLIKYIDLHKRES